MAMGGQKREWPTPHAQLKVIYSGWFSNFRQNEEFEMDTWKYEKSGFALLFLLAGCFALLLREAYFVVEIWIVCLSMNEFISKKKHFTREAFKGITFILNFDFQPKK